MKAVVFHGPRDVAVEEVADPRIEEPLDAVIRITTANICGSDLHPYEGRADLDAGMVLGHENMGIVEETGPAVRQLRAGDRVSVPFNVACGTCANCERGLTAFCLTVSRGGAGGAYGYAGMGRYDGGQAEYLRVPFADFNCLVLPPGSEHEADYALLSDVFPAGYHATVLADVRPGDSVVVFGAGPVGLLAVHSAFLRGAAEVFAVDKVPSRLQIAERMGAMPVNYAETDPVEYVLDATAGAGASKGVEAVGWQAHDPEGQEHAELTLNGLVRCVMATGTIGVVGAFAPQDEYAPQELTRRGQAAFDVGLFFAKGLRMGSGQTSVKAYNRQLRSLITAGRASPSVIVSHELSLDEAPEAYRHFDNRDEGWTKILLHPAA